MRNLGNLMQIKRLTRRWERRVRDFCDANYSKIPVEPGDLNDYSRCQNVATHYALKNSDEKLAAVMYKHQSDPDYAVHFINFRDNQFIDNSIGWRAEFYDYRFIRWVYKNEMVATGGILFDLQKYFVSMATRLERIFGKLEI